MFPKRTWSFNVEHTFYFSRWRDSKSVWHLLYSRRTCTLWNFEPFTLLSSVGLLAGEFVVSDRKFNLDTVYRWNFMLVEDYMTRNIVSHLFKKHQEANSELKKESHERPLQR